jgi:lipopolysaccharide export system protein LptC
MNSNPNDQAQGSASPQPAARGDYLRRDPLAARSHSRGYTYFVRLMRLALPLVALGILAIVLAWPKMNVDPAMVVATDIQVPKSIGRNELTAPVFESKDQKGQPFRITAKRAIQGEENDALVVLDTPAGVMRTNKSAVVNLNAQKGAYREDIQRIFLEGKVDVDFVNDNGDGQYRLQSETLHMDMKSSEAWTEDKVFVSGEMGQVEAAGMDARNSKGLLIFKGPATLTLNESLPGF